MNCREMQQLVHGYLDGELDLVRNLEVEGHLQTCSACAHRLANYQSFHNALQNDAFYFRAPAELRTQVRRSIARAHSQSRTFRLRTWATFGAVAASIAIVWFAIGWMMGGKKLEMREIVSSHVRSLMATHLTDVASSDQHTVKPWFKGQLDFSPPVKDLSGEDFALVGGRLDYVDDRPVAALVYQRRKHVINLFIWPTNSDSATNTAAQTWQGYNLIHWAEGGLAFWAVSDLNEKELEEFVQLIRK